MGMEGELTIKYGPASYVVSAACSLCGEKMPQPDANLELSAERVQWFSERFLAHKGGCRAGSVRELEPKPNPPNSRL